MTGWTRARFRLDRGTRAALFTAVALTAAATSRDVHAQAQTQPATAPAGTTRALTLADAIALAKSRAPHVHAAFAKIAAAEASVDRAKAGHLPLLSASGTGTALYSQGPLFVSGLTTTNENVTALSAQAAINLSWTLYDFGRTSAAIDSAHAGMTAASFEAQASEQVAMAEAAVAYYTLLTDAALVRSAEEVRAEREKVLGITRRLTTAGYRSPVDETRAQIQVEIAQLDIAIARAAQDKDASRLAAALLLDPGTTFQLTPPIEITIESRGDADGVTAIRTRREVAAARARVESAEHDVASARAGHLPTLAATGQGALQYTYTRIVITPNPAVTQQNPTEIASGTLSLTAPLFDATVNANVRAAEAALAAAKANLEQTMLSARTEATQASRALVNAHAILNQSERLAAGAAANLAAVEDRYSNGLDSPLVLADAQREDALARVAVVRGRLAYDVAKVLLLAGLSRVDELAKAR
jgi:outer membrane protein TolC